MNIIKNQVTEISIGSFTIPNMNINIPDITYPEPLDDELAAHAELYILIVNKGDEWEEFDMDNVEEFYIKENEQHHRDDNSDKKVTNDSADIDDSYNNAE